MFKVLLCVVRVDQNGSECSVLICVVRWIRMDQNVQSVVMCGEGGSECSVLLCVVRWIRIDQNIQSVVTCEQVDQNGSECSRRCYV